MHTRSIEEACEYFWNGLPDANLLLAGRIAAAGLRVDQSYYGCADSTARYLDAELGHDSPHSHPPVCFTWPTSLSTTGLTNPFAFAV